MSSIGTKAALMCATTAVGVTMFASVALAAPTIPAGMTSYPGMSGNCASCHSYAAATPAPAPVPAPAPAPAPAPTPTAAEITAALPALPSTGTLGGSPYIIIIVNPTYASPAGAALPAAAAPTVTAPTVTSSSSNGAEGGGD